MEMPDNIKLACMALRYIDILEMDYFRDGDKPLIDLMAHCFKNEKEIYDYIHIDDEDPLPAYIDPERINDVYYNYYVDVSNRFKKVSKDA